MYLQKVISRKNYVKNQFFAGILKVKDKNSRILIQIRIHQSEAWISGSGSVPQTNGSGSESRSGSIGQRHGYADPDSDPPQNVMDPQHCQFHYCISCLCSGVRDEHVLLHEVVERRVRLGAQLDQECGHLSLPPPPHTHPPGPPLGSCHRRLQVQCSQLLAQIMFVNFMYVLGQNWLVK